MGGVAERLLLVSFSQIRDSEYFQNGLLEWKYHKLAKVREVLPLVVASQASMVKSGKQVVRKGNNPTS